MVLGIHHIFSSGRLRRNRPLLTVNFGSTGQCPQKHRNEVKIECLRPGTLTKLYVARRMFLWWVFSASSLRSLIDRISLIVCGIRASLMPLLEMLNVCTPNICAEGRRSSSGGGGHQGDALVMMRGGDPDPFVVLRQNRWEQSSTHHAGIDVFHVTLST